MNFLLWHIELILRDIGIIPRWLWPLFSEIGSFVIKLKGNEINPKAFVIIIKDLPPSLNLLYVFKVVALSTQEKRVHIKTATCHVMLKLGEEDAKFYIHSMQARGMKVLPHVPFYSIFLCWISFQDGGSSILQKHRFSITTKYKVFQMKKNLLVFLQKLGILVNFC